MKPISKGTYSNEFVEKFPGDKSLNNSSRQTPRVLYSLVNPTAVSDPKLLAWSEDLARTLGISSPNKEDLQVLSGNLVAEGMKPYAACYAGHQFGNWAGQLGDGRAITLTEWIAEDGKTWELQLKGAGLTPYSRRADGRAVLRSSLREYILSEAMHHLGVPTTRALSLVATGDKVIRDMFYNGNPQEEPGAIVMRVAPSFLRFGNFEMPAARQELDNLRALVDHTIEKFYPHITGENRIITWYKEVIERTATMIVEWMRVGFVHGVMNTDNMSILGLTIDYGPFSFVDDYDPNFTPNTTDLPGRRYAFGKQPSIAKWNLAALANAIAPLLEDTDELVEAVDSYDDIFWEKYFTMICSKLGLDFKTEHLEMIRTLEQVMSSIKPDMTLFFKLLEELPSSIDSKELALAHFNESLYRTPSAAQSDKLFEFIQAYKPHSTSVSKEKMQRANPVFIPRNYLLHQAIEQLQSGSNELFLELQEAIRDPYSDRFKKYLVKRPDWAAQTPGSSMLSCSS